MAVAGAASADGCCNRFRVWVAPFMAFRVAHLLCEVASTQSYHVECRKRVVEHIHVLHTTWGLLGSGASAGTMASLAALRLLAASHTTSVFHCAFLRLCGFVVWGWLLSPHRPRSS